MGTSDRPPPTPFSHTFVISLVVLPWDLSNIPDVAWNMRTDGGLCVFGS